MITVFFSLFFGLVSLRIMFCFTHDLSNDMIAFILFYYFQSSEYSVVRGSGGICLYSLHSGGRSRQISECMQGQHGL